MLFFPDMRKRYPFRFASLEERKIFYAKEFSIGRIKEWFRKHGMPLPQICALDAGTESSVLIKRNWKNTLFYFPFTELREKIKKYLPEDIYYDRCEYLNPRKVLAELIFPKPLPQELVFDIDADNIPCSHIDSQEVCMVCLRKAWSYSLALKRELEKKFHKVHLVYSGRGFHVHVADKKAYGLSVDERSELNRIFKKFPIDPWVSGGNIRLIRIPYTLHGGVSRIVLPITVQRSLSLKQSIPKFLR